MDDAAGWVPRGSGGGAVVVERLALFLAEFGEGLRAGRLVPGRAARGEGA